jgi:hypothetical protein
VIGGRHSVLRLSAIRPSAELHKNKSDSVIPRLPDPKALSELPPFSQSSLASDGQVS